MVGKAPNGQTWREFDNTGLGTPYLDASQRERYKTKFINGRVVNDYWEKPELLGSSDRKPTEYLYVMDKNGDFYIGLEREISHHSAFLAGGEVAAAGTMTIKSGKILTISNDSGHYKPDKEMLKQAHDRLKELGIKNVKPILWSPKDLQTRTDPKDKSER